MEIAFTKSTSASETIRLLWKIFACHGFPTRLKSDNAQAFHSREFQEFLSEYGVEHVTSPPLWPQANGEVERQNRSLLKRLKIAASEGLPLEIEAYKFVLLYNSTPHSTTGMPPAQLLFQRQLRDKLPSILQPSVLRDEFSDRDASKKFDGQVNADTRRKAVPSSIQPGDNVLLQAKPTGKLSPSFEKTPFQVVETDGKEVTIQRGTQVLRRSVAAVKRCPSPVRSESQVTPASGHRSYADVTANRAPSPPIPDVAETSAVSPSVLPLTSPDTTTVSAGGATPSSLTTPDTPTSAVRTRSGRVIRKPAKLDL